MRIITGTARGLRLETPEGSDTRPTADRVKEALFSMLHFDIESRRVLDLFAGSGQLGLEALSQGAALAVFTDVSRECVDVILRNAAKTKLKDRCRVSVHDYKNYLKGAAGREKFHIIFLDPPYNTSCMKDALELIVKYGVLEDGGVIVCETDTELAERKRRKGESEPDDGELVLKDVFCGDAELMSLFEIKRTQRYGRTRLTLLRIKDFQN